MSLYRWLLKLHGRAFREEYGDELLSTLAEREADRAHLGWFRRQWARARELSAVIGSAWSLASPLTDRKRPRRPELSSWLSHDLRFALRSFRSNPGFTIVVILTLAIGIGANSSIFSLMDQVLLRALPVVEPERIVVLSSPGTWSGWSMGRDRFSYPFYREFRDENENFDGALARYADSVTLEYGGATERIESVLVSGNYFDVLGVRPASGRLLRQSDDETPGAHAVAVLSHRYWQSRFGGESSIVGDSVRLNGHPMTVVGVARAGFSGVQVGHAPDIFVPMMMKAQITPTWDHLDNRRTRFLEIFARLKPGMSLEETEARANVTFLRINERDLTAIPNPSERFQTRFRERRLLLKPGMSGVSALREQFSTPLLVLMGMVGLVLVICCANVANLLLARSAARQKEVALRLALGASRARIVRQLLVESLTLALAGGGVALVLSSWTTHLLLRTLPFEGAARTFSADPDARVVGFTFLVSLMTGLVFGLAPAFQATAGTQASTLKEEGLAGALPQARFRRFIVVAQVALSLLLMVGAGLFARSLYNLRHLDPGFDSDRLLTFSIDPSLNGYSQAELITFFGELRRELGALPGVSSVSMAELSAMSQHMWMSTVHVEGYEPSEDENMNPRFNGVGPDYFATMGIPLLRGREFTEADAAGEHKVAIINETMARYFFGHDDPIGRRFGFGRRSSELDIEIVGLVSDGKYSTLKEEAPRFGYLPYMQDEPLSSMTFYVRTRADELSLIEDVRGKVRRLDASLPIYDVKSMRAQVDESMFLDRLIAGLSAAFGLVACLLAAIGLYGVMSYMVTRRTREIGIRMALGAERASVVVLVLREVAFLAVVGVGAGLPLGALLARALESQLFELSPWDPMTWAVSASVLLGVAFASGYVPAARASRVNPIIALRWE